MAPKSTPGRPWDPWGPLLKHASVLVPFFDQFLTLFRRFGGPWGPPFSQFFRPIFKTIFWTPAVLAFRRFGSQFGSILGAILGAFWGTGEKVKIELPSRRELNLQGPGHSKIDTFSVHFLGWLWGSTFSYFL